VLKLCTVHKLNVNFNKVIRAGSFAKSNVRATATKGSVGGLRGGQNVSVVDRLPKKLNFYESTTGQNNLKARHNEV